MAIKISLHPTQGKIIYTLRYKENSRFSELNIDKLSNDHFTFHINKLLSLGLIQKIENKYSLTNEGKELSHSLDNENFSVAKQGKVCILLVCVNDKGDYLIQQRLRQPYYGYFGFVGGKVLWGETIPAAAERILFKTTGLTANLSFLTVHHKIDTTKNNKILEDKYYFVFKGEQIKGILQRETIGAKNAWMDREAIKNLQPSLTGMRVFFDVLGITSFSFTEQKTREDDF